MKTDIHQHVWTEPLVEALSQRAELPFVRDEHGLTVLFGAGERPYVIDLDGEASARRAELVAQDGLDRALVCLSSPLGIESLPRKQATRLIDAYLEGALSLGRPFDVWGAVALDDLDPCDVDRALERGCVGISLPARALDSVDMLARMAPVLSRIQSHGAPLFIHPGPAARLPVREAPLADPLWWPALTRYVAEMQAAWLVWASSARRLFPELRVIFSMLAGLAPLQFERLRSRGGPETPTPDPLAYYDTSSYGSHAVGLMERVVGSTQLVYGSDRPCVDPREQDALTSSGEQGSALEWEPLAYNSERVLSEAPSGTEPLLATASKAGRALSASPSHAKDVPARPTRIAVLARAVS